MLIFLSLFLTLPSHYNLHVYFRGQMVQELMSWPVGLILAVRLKKCFTFLQMNEAKSTNLVGVFCVLSGKFC